MRVAGWTGFGLDSGWLWDFWISVFGFWLIEELLGVRCLSFGVLDWGVGEVSCGVLVLVVEGFGTWLCDYCFVLNTSSSKISL